MRKLEIIPNREDNSIAVTLTQTRVTVKCAPWRSLDWQGWLEFCLRDDVPLPVSYRGTLRPGERTVRLRASNRKKYPTIRLSVESFEHRVLDLSTQHEEAYCKAEMIENCDKRRYPDAIAAKYTLEKIRRINDPEHKETRAYRCPRCRGWHLTSQPKGKP